MKQVNSAVAVNLDLALALDLLLPSLAPPPPPIQTSRELLNIPPLSLEPVNSLMVATLAAVDSRADFVLVTLLLKPVMEAAGKSLTVLRLVSILLKMLPRLMVLLVLVDLALPPPPPPPPSQPPPLLLQLQPSLVPTVMQAVLLDAKQDLPSSLILVLRAASVVPSAVLEENAETSSLLQQMIPSLVVLILHLVRESVLETRMVSFKRTPNIFN